MPERASGANRGWHRQFAVVVRCHKHSENGRCFGTMSFNRPGGNKSSVRLPEEGVRAIVDREGFLCHFGRLH